MKAAEQAHTRQPSVSSTLDNNATNANPPAADVAGHARRHSRNPSRAGHARGHSRVGSISISADSMAATAAAALRQSLNAGQPPAQRPTSTAAPSRPSSWLPGQQTHARTHSRTHSRANSRASIRPPSFIGLAPSNSASTLLAVEHGPGSFPAAKSGEWDDVEEQQAVNRASQRLSTGKPESTDRPLSGSSSSHARRQSRHSRKTSLSTKRESIELMGGLGYPSISVSQDNPVHNYRASRRISHRLSGIQPASVLFGGTAGERRSAVRDFDWRGSLQGGDMVVTHDGEDRLTALEKLEGRTRSSSPSNPDGQLQAAQQTQLPPSPISPTPARSDRRSSLAHSRQSSVQLPSFDEIHGQDGMDKRSSTHLLEVNEKNTHDDSNIGAMSPSSTWPNLLAPAAPSSGMSHSSSLSELRSPKARPSSMYISLDTTQPEGLGTLMEEEEEEDSASPVVVRPAVDLSGRHTTDVEDQETLRKRQEAERETIKKTRRSSLQPRPLKLKSRPASLFVTPGMQKKAGLMVASPTYDLGTMSESVEEEAREGEEQPSQDETVKKSADGTATIAQSPSLARDWSMAAAQAKALGSPTLARSADSASASATPSKPGMRTLRLASQSGFSAGSDSPTSSISTLPTIAQKRSSLLYNNTINSASPAQSDLGYGFPSSSSSGSLRRSSLIYKPASSTDSVPSQSSVSSFSPGAMAAMEELKAKNLRDAGALESLRRQVERLTAELASETERATRDYAQLERWSAEEKQNLCARIESLEADITETGKKLAEREDALKLTEQEFEQHRTQSQEQKEDLEAERDMLQEDVDGWRTRCGDLEKTLKAERGTLEEERRQSHALRHRFQALVAKLREDGVDVPPLTPMDDESSETPRDTSLPIDLASALRSPLDLSAGAGGYFSPRASPIDPPPQAVKLLKDMRQQIFNLAGTLDHERKQHLTAQQKADELQAENERLKLELEQARAAAASHSAFEHDAPAEQPSPTRSLSSSGSGSFSGGRRGNGFVGAGKNKRHVFAYDSSMSSFDQSNTSMGSGATSVTSASDADHSVFGSDDKYAGEFDDDSSSAPNTADTILPLGGLQPLAEEDEGVTSERETLTSSVDTAAPRSPVASEMHARRASSFDLEAGEPCDAFSEEADGGPAPRYSSGDSRPSQDTTASYVDSTDYDTPALEASASFAPAAENDPRKTPLVSVDGKALSLSGLSGSNSTRSSGTSSYETHGPVSPVDIEAQGEDACEVEEEEELEEDDTVEVDRPEFIREWSFQEALRAVQVKGSGKSTKRSKSRKQRAPSIDDFFGLLLCEQLDPLPPLQSSKSSLEMPPVYVEQYEDSAPSYGEVMGAKASRQSGLYSGVRQASVAGARRPPVARSAYVRDSVSSMESGFTHGTSNSASTAGSLPAGAAGMALASGLGSRALSRMSLQGLTSAFSGLGGYLAGQSGAAVNAAAAATTMCSKGEMESESRNASVSWTVQPRTGEENHTADALAFASSLRPVGGTAGAKRFSSTPAPPQRQSMLSKRSHESARDQPQPSPRRFIQKWDVPAPTASPIWTLDFVPATAGADDAVFSI